MCKLCWEIGKRDLQEVRPGVWVGSDRNGRIVSTVVKEFHEFPKDSKAFKEMVDKEFEKANESNPKIHQIFQGSVSCNCKCKNEWLTKTIVATWNTYTCSKCNHYVSSQGFEEEIKKYDTAIKLNPQDAITYNNKGSTLARLERQDEALKEFDKAIKVNPRSIRAHYNKANSLILLRRYEEAIKEYDIVIGLNPKNPEYVDAYNNNGMAYFALGRYDEAIKEFDTAIKLSSEKSRAHSNKGAALGCLGKYDEAIKEFDTAIKLNPKYAGAYANKGYALRRLGRYKEAIKEYDMAIKLEPNNSSYLKSKNEILEYMKDNPLLS